MWKLTSKCLEVGCVRERRVNKGVLMATMGRFLSGNVSDSFRRVQYLFRLYSLPHRAVGRKSRPRMRGQFLPPADPRWHSHTQTLQHHQSLFFLPVLLARPGVRANFTMPPLFVCWSCVCNAFCRGLCVWISVEVFVVITLEAMASARDAPCCSPQLSTRHSRHLVQEYKKALSFRKYYMFWVHLVKVVLLTFHLFYLLCWWIFEGDFGILYWGQTPPPSSSS